jgi:adenylyltransferase/sulfurtransferase
MNKAASAALAIHRYVSFLKTLAYSSLNPHIKVTTYEVPIDQSNALSLLRPHDLLIDCTDRPMTRYLLSDAAVTLDLPLISGAAISSAGQWAVYGGQTAKGKRRACYRCLWPRMVEAGGNDRCEELGVYGVVTGMIGTGMASEVIKVLLGKDGERSSRARYWERLMSDDEPLLHMMHLGGNPLIRTIRIRPPSPKCIACGPDATVKVEEYDYATFCSGHADVVEPDGLGNGGVGERISVQVRLSFIVNEIGLIRQEFSEVIGEGKTTVIDTRPELEFGICSIPNTISMPHPLLS